MTKLFDYAATISVNTALAVAYYHWQYKGVEQAGNLFLFYVWFLSICGSLTLFITPEAKNHKHKDAALKAMLWVATMAVLIGTIWAGHIFVACLYVFAWVASMSYKQKARAAWEASI